MKTKVPITYTGSNTENLYVLGIRNGREVKLKVKEIGCHGPIRVSEIIEDSTSYESYDDLAAAAAAGKLEENTIYVINEGGVETRYLYYNNVLSSLGENTSSVVSGLEFGKSFSTFEKLYAAKSNGELKSQKIYTVTDKGTIEQYILASDDNLLQIAGGINEITSGDESDEESASATEVTSGIINYNLSELVNGDYRFKNHKEITTVCSDMPSLVSGIQMFYGTSLTSFCGDLSSLGNARHMFSKNCKLNPTSIVSIVDGIKDWSEVEDSENTEMREINIGYSTDDEENSDDFISETITEFKKKGWSATFYRNGNLNDPFP